MQKNPVLFCVSLHRLSQIQKVNLFATGQRLQSLVRIENSAHTNVLHKILTHDRVGINLNRVAESHDHKPNASLADFIAHLPDQFFGDEPCLLPIIVVGLEIGHVFHSDFFGRGRSPIFTCSRLCWRDRRSAPASPFSQAQFADGLGVMN